jgi:hypothetical protein
MGLERPVPDSVEQNQDATTGADEQSEGPEPEEVPLEADPADAAEQARELDIDDDDYR